jgi:hypothetical protein
MGRKLTWKKPSSCTKSTVLQIMGIEKKLDFRHDHAHLESLDVSLPHSRCTLSETVENGMVQHLIAQPALC